MFHSFLYVYQRVPYFQRSNVSWGLEDLFDLALSNRVIWMRISGSHEGEEHDLKMGYTLLYTIFLYTLYTHTYTHTYIHTYLPTYRPTDLPTYLHTYIPIHRYVRTYVHPSIHTYTSWYGQCLTRIRSNGTIVLAGMVWCFNIFSWALCHQLDLATI